MLALRYHVGEQLCDADDGRSRSRRSQQVRELRQGCIEAIHGSCWGLTRARHSPRDAASADMEKSIGRQEAGSMGLVVTRTAKDGHCVHQNKKTGVMSSGHLIPGSKP